MDSVSVIQLSRGCAQPLEIRRVRVQLAQIQDGSVTALGKTQYLCLTFKVGNRRG
jgi:hypothetical protein